MQPLLGLICHLLFLNDRNKLVWLMALEVNQRRLLGMHESHFVSALPPHFYRK